MWNSDSGLFDSQTKFLNTMEPKQKDNVFTQFPNITCWMQLRWIECSESFNHDLVPIKEECQSLFKINQVREMSPKTQSSQTNFKSIVINQLKVCWILSRKIINSNIMLYMVVAVQLLSCAGLLRLHGLQPTRLLCPWNFPGKNTGVGCYFLLQGIFLTQGSNLVP